MDDPYFVPTKSSRVNPSHEVVIHENRKKKVVNKNERKNKAFAEEENEEITMKAARFEVYKFAKSALSAPEKQQSKIELAIRLGAKPPKNKFINYKVLKENAKKALEEEKRNIEPENITNKKVPLHQSKLNQGALRRKRQIGSGILNVYGTVKKKDLRFKK